MVGSWWVPCVFRSKMVGSWWAPFAFPSKRWAPSVFEVKWWAPCVFPSKMESKYQSRGVVHMQADKDINNPALTQLPLQHVHIYFPVCYLDVVLSKLAQPPYKLKTPPVAASSSNIVQSENYSFALRRTLPRWYRFCSIFWHQNWALRSCQIEGHALKLRVRPCNALLQRRILQLTPSRCTHDPISAPYPPSSCHCSLQPLQLHRLHLKRIALN